ncbi:MAG TPA: DUF2092 domain-containing protein [Isosphaeraceae bacterium]
MSANITPDDRLARAEAALRDVPIPDGPSEESLARALAVARAAEGRPDVVPWTWRRAMLSTLKIAAALAAVGGVLYVARPPAATAFEEVAQKLHNAHTLAYNAVTTVEGAPPAMNPMKMKLFFKEPKSMRMEMQVADGGSTTVFDGARGRMLTLDPARKSAIVFEMANPKVDFVTKTVESLRNLPGKDAKPVGKERIGDVEAEGYRVVQDGLPVLAWVDPKTRLPLRIDVDDRIGGKQVKATLSDFRLDPPLDDALFRTEPPAGYSLQTINGGTLFAKPEEVVPRLLRAYADRHDGAFPRRLDDPTAFESLFPKDKKEMPNRKASPEDLERVMLVGRVLTLQREVKGYGYKADGVKLGDADKIIFWYKPEGADKYRVVYGDLHVADVTADQLPEKPKN